MIPGEDITSLALSLRLKELDFPQNTTLFYAYHDHSEAYISTTVAPVHPQETVLCAAYAQSDLRTYLPDTMALNGKLYILDVAKTTGDDFYIGYREKDSDTIMFRYSGFSADSYAKLVIELLEKGKIGSPKTETIKS